MAYSGINLGNVKLINRSGILKLLNDNGSLSRKDIAEQLGLSAAAVTQICSELLAGGIIKETGLVQEENRAGRRKILLEINYERSHVISVCIEENETCVAVCNLRGKVIKSVTLPTQTQKSPEQFLECVAQEIENIIAMCKIKKKFFLGIGVSVPGAVDKVQGSSIHAYRIWEEPVPVAAILKSLTKIPVVIENNVVAFSEAELMFGSGRSEDKILFLKWGPGVGAALSGSANMPTLAVSKTIEIGHIIADPEGAPCRCGKRGCLETQVSTHAISAQAREKWSGAKGKNIRAASIYEWIVEEDPQLNEVLNFPVAQLAKAVVNAATLLSPDKIVIYGKLFDIPKIKDAFIANCIRLDSRMNDAMIRTSALAGQLNYIGAAATVVNEFFIGRI